jgi:AcrR family transcriptional regulator
VLSIQTPQNARALNRPITQITATESGGHAKFRQMPRLALHSNRRDLNKQEKLRRIKSATRELFIQKGYDETTIREIVRRANIGLGTIFSYASHKRDLLFLIYNDDQDSLTQRAFGTPPRGSTLLAQLIAAFGIYYQFFSREPVFMRYVLRELTFYTTGREAARFHIGREAIITRIEALVDKAKRSEQIATAEKSYVIAEVIFGIYQAELRRWLSFRRPKADKGVFRLRRALRILINGLQPS